ncbi:MAG: HAMP domain-containing sensor histidine kinase [Methanocalculus sp.]|uniref:sensor histidine kinase n=1 Tax=Methanocalculus sp. TaxID=2004547 RepID=UPI00271CE607|nr:HAMP domain-containing sensor histidine kinase [Methanocalculus sp.]MDO9540057.1 HAMP domain-containing sensor histidine kinase [Methanocalculus sp.]
MITKFSGKISYRRLLIGIIILIIIIVTSTILHVNYQVSRLTLEEHTLSLQENTEYNLQQSMVLVDRGLFVFDQSLDYQLKNSMDIFLSVYEESERKPDLIDLESLKRSFGEGYELYIINETGVIEYTTYPPEYLMDFSVYPDFFRRLTDIREGNVFVADRILPDIATGKLRKYIYHPTPDHRYILEIGYIDEEIKQMRSALRYTEVADPIRKMNPYLSSIRIFTFLGDEIGNISYIPEDWRTAIITDVLQTGTTVTVDDAISATHTRYLFIDLSENDNPPEMNMVAELVYTTLPIKEKLNDLFITHLMIALLAIMIGSTFAYGLTIIVTRPIHRIVEDTEAIAEGDLDHRIRESALPELQSLSLALQQMVDRLKEMMSSLRVSEEELKVKNEELEARVEERMGELKQAHIKANFYLDIITHDINNTNHTSLLYLELLSDEAYNDTTAPFIEGLRTSLRKSDEIIGNVTTLRYIQDVTSPLSPINLQKVLEKEAHIDERITVLMKEENIIVLADPLLPQVITNIVGNSLKFGGEDVQVTIIASIEGDDVIIRIDDTGSGISDQLKPHVFRKYSRGTERVRGKGLGLFIVQTLIEERYGGSISILDRVQGDHTQGVSFIIRLKKGSSLE